MNSARRFRFRRSLATSIHTQQPMQEQTASVAVVGFNTHKEESEILRYNTAGTNQITFDEALEEVEIYIHMSITDKQGESDTDVKAQTGKAREVFLLVKNI
ncbi:unnamed protein product [Schistosoma margrebowiei]|uniref:Uncharacterized protein n=1 Tax=Schistosoma margrebowiei TaxID=48269 RepID=A0A183LDF4_9TREM|nr:unnamed protein product [Schistosoma margrebowiei]